MKTPDFLRKGDTVAIVCPASYIKNHIKNSISILNSWGLDVKIGETVTAQHHQFAGTDTLRASDLQTALDMPGIKAVFAARGGYGTVRIIDNLDFNNFVKKPKWVIGFSDITVLHSHIHHNFNIPTIHGQMPKSFDDSTVEALNSLKNALFGNTHRIQHKQTAFPNRPGIAEGQLIGGNLAILHSLVASQSDMNYERKILFIEDVGEMFYNIDRMLWTLKRARKLEGLAGLIIGSFSAMRDSTPSFGQSIEEIILEKVHEYDFPVAFHYPAGHIENNHSLILGKQIKMCVKKHEVSIQYM